ncbi:hypothetical protein [Streptomyces sp. NPDC058663]|uniref:hypothetical protein n=1 Tax=Streptomyces sp. NPDC058663 TaxID=3346584 RepID=UPI0036565FFF
MVRNALGSVLALVGAATAVWSPFNAWYDGRHGRDYRIDDLFNGITDAKAELVGSLLLPFVFVALVTVVGVLLRSRLLVGLAGLVALGFTVFWMVRQGQAASGLAVNADGSGLGMGVAGALGGGVLILLGAALMRGRRRRARRAGTRRAAPYPQTEETYAPDAYPPEQDTRRGPGTYAPDAYPPEQDTRRDPGPYTPDTYPPEQDTRRDPGPYTPDAYPPEQDTRRDTWRDSRQDPRQDPGAETQQAPMPPPDHPGHRPGHDRPL